MKPLAADDPRVIGEYRLRARLGAGGMGRVYLGMSPAGRAVAVKVVHPDLASDTEFLRRFQHEVAAARAVSGIYTAPVVASGLDERPPWLATAFVPGPSLDQVVTEHGPLPEPALWPLLAGLVEALQAIHACGVVHRDLKPANVLLAADGPRVIDFGISRAVDGTALTAAGVVFGTPGYMSPEQAEGKPAGPASDVFALGCVIGYAATGAGPFGTGTAAAVLYRVVHADAMLDAAPPPLREIVSGCLAKDPAARPTPAALATALAARDRGTGPSAVAFWPRSVANVIGAYQARLEQETRSPGRPTQEMSWTTLTHTPASPANPGNGGARGSGVPAGPGGTRGYTGGGRATRPRMVRPARRCTRARRVRPARRCTRARRVRPARRCTRARRVRPARRARRTRAGTARPGVTPSLRATAGRARRLRPADTSRAPGSRATRCRTRSDGRRWARCRKACATRSG